MTVCCCDCRVCYPAHLLKSMKNEYIEGYYEDLGERVAKTLTRKSQQCEYLSRGGTKLYSQITKGWQGDKKVTEKEVLPPPSKKRRTCTLKQPNYIAPEEKAIVSITPNPEDRKTLTEVKVCLLGSEELTDLLRTENWSRSCAREGFCETNGNWRLVWRAEAILKSVPGIADDAWKESIRIKLSVLKLKVESGEIIIEPPRFTKFTERERADYEEHRDQIHLAALRHPVWASEYIPGWVLPIPPQLKFATPSACCCRTCKINS